MTTDTPPHANPAPIQHVLVQLNITCRCELRYDSRPYLTRSITTRVHDDDCALGNHIANTTRPLL